MKKLRAAMLVMLAYAGISAAQASAPEKITFVCEHGVAKSVIAAAHFNRLAAAAGLNYRAVARGVSVEPVLQAATVTGLQKDGIDSSGFTPTNLNADDEKSSVMVVTIGVDNEPTFVRTAKLKEWDGVPAVSKSYDLARDDLLQRLQALVAELQAGAK